LAHRVLMEGIVSARKTITPDDEDESELDYLTAD
jgi:hypothetical protein